MRRYPSSARLGYSFGPGPMTFAVKVLLWVNIGAYLLSWLIPAIVPYLGFRPASLVGQFFLWQPVTYMFLHGDFFHILINMLVLWMFGVQLERLWGTRFFVKYYFVTGVGAAATTFFLSLMPLAVTPGLYYSLTIGASGAIFGLLLAYALYYPDTPIYFLGLFPVPAKYMVMILGAVALLSSFGGPGGVAHTAHLGGLVVGYVYLKWRGRRPMTELKYRYFKWKMNRMRQRFDIHEGGKAKDWNRRVH
jgi:membrane associated rhomboid family serine protease